MNNRIPVTSSNLVSVGYNHTAGVLTVEFKGGALYNYFRVPQEKYEALMAAESVGKYLNAEIKPNHHVEKLADDAANHLAHNQRQLDADGVEVGISREALTDVMMELHFLRFAYHAAGDARGDQPFPAYVVAEYEKAHGWPAPGNYHA